MQVPRDVSRRMLEAAEQTPIVDIHERLVPESKRVGQRFDLLSWFLAYAGTEVQALGLARPDLALLANTNADPEQRWTLFSTYWPYLRTTGVGRVVLRMAWDLFGIAELDERTWKDISAKLWKISEPGFYQKLFAEKANLHNVLVDNQVDAGSLSCHLVCNYEHVLSMSTRARLDALVKRLDEPCTTLEQLDGLLEKSMQQDIQKGCVSFKIVALPEVLTPSIEQVSWAMGRLFRREEVDGPAEPALHSHLLHHFLSVLSESTIPVQVHIRGEPDVERLGAWAVQYPKVRFVGVYGGWGNPFSMMVLARTMPNLAVAVGDLWPVAPQLARQALRIWVQGVPLCKLFACSGNTTLVEALCVHTWLAREQVAALFAEMVAEGVLDEGDAHVAIRHLLYENALSYFDLENQNA